MGDTQTGDGRMAYLHRYRTHWELDADIADVRLVRDT